MDILRRDIHVIPKKFIASLLLIEFILPSSLLRAQSSFEFNQNPGQFEIKKGFLDIKLHPQSPSQCGVDLFEIGVSHEKQGGDFEPHFAVLRDRFDDSYPGIAPKIRRIYSYYYSPSFHWRFWDRFSAPPTTILDTETLKEDIGLRVLVSIATWIGGNIQITGIPFAIRMITNLVERDHDFERTRALYTLKLIADDTDLSTALPGEKAEVDRVYALGTEFNWKGLMISSEYENLVSQFVENERRGNRKWAFLNLISLLNREGLKPFPLNQDYILVYYDLNEARARPVDTHFTELSQIDPAQFSPEQLAAAKDGLVPLGIYSLAQAGGPMLSADLNSEEHADVLRWSQRLHNIGRQFEASFLSFPVWFAVVSTDFGLSFILRKKGENILSDALKTDAELYALLESGLAQVDPSMANTIKSRLRDLPSTNETTNLKKSKEAMDDYLRGHANDLCDEISAIRQKEFEKSYLSFGEKTTAFFSDLWHSVFESAEYREKQKVKRRDLISNRQPVIDARFILTGYDERKQNYDTNTIIKSLETIATARDSKDIELIARFINGSGNAAIEKTAIISAGIHGDDEFVWPLIRFLEKIDASVNLDYDTVPIREIFETLHKMRFEDDVNPLYRLRYTEAAVDRFTGVSNPEIASRAAALVEWLKTQARNPQE